MAVLLHMLTVGIEGTEVRLRAVLVGWLVRCDAGKEKNLGLETTKA